VAGAEYHRKYNLARYHRLRAEYMALLGGICVDCGTDQDLEFDHDDASSKSFDVGKLLNYSKAVRDEELRKCVPRCSPCHRVKSLLKGDINSVGHGEGKSGKKNCPCAPCKDRKAEYMRNYVRKTS
jgi:hypothetical protein